MTTKISKVLFYSILVFLLLPENLVNPISPGLDPSWHIATELAVINDLTFGGNFVFTYGPLGFLDTKLALCFSKWVILSFELCVIFAFVYALSFYFSKYNTWKTYLLLLLFCFVSRGKSQSVIHLFFPCFILHAYIYQKNKNVISLWICSIISCFSFFCKINFGLISLIFFYTVSFVFLVTSEKEQRYKIWIPVVFNCLLVGLLVIFFKVELLGYIKGSFEFTKSYSAAMTHINSKFWNTAFIIAIVSFVLLVFSVFLVLRTGFKQISNWLAIFLASVCFFLLFKNGFTRADTHRYEFVYLMGVPFFLLALTSTKYYDFRNLIFICVCLVSFAFTFLFRKKDMFSVNYLKQIVSNMPIPKLIYGETYDRFEVSNEYISTIRDNSVDIFPWEISNVYQYGLNYRPRPVMQSYAAYNPYLDSINAVQIKTSGANYLLYANETIDNRTPFWDESMTKREIARHYEVISDFSALQKACSSIKNASKFSQDAFCMENPLVCHQFLRDSLSIEDYFVHNKKAEWYSKETLPLEYNFVLLKRRPTPLKVVSDSIVLNKILKIGDELIIPNSNGLLYLYADLEYSTIGKLKKTLFQISNLRVCITDVDGAKSEYKAVVPILQTGVLVNKAVIDNLDAYLCFKYNGTLNKKIKSIRFLPDANFEKTMNVRIKEIVNEKL